MEFKQKFRRIKHGQKIIDIRPTARYNIVNLIRKPRISLPYVD